MIAKVIASLILVAALANGNSAFGAKGKRNVNIELDSFTQSFETDAWTAYGLGLAAALSKIDGVDSVPVGIYAPSFRAELYARSKQLAIWRELQEKKAVDYGYMAQMLEVEAAGLLPEYVWRYHRNPHWSEAEAPPRVTEFAAWAEGHLTNHRPLTGARVELSLPESN